MPTVLPKKNSLLKGPKQMSGVRKRTSKTPTEKAKDVGEAVKAAVKTAKWANIMTKWLIARQHKGGPKWKIVNFMGPAGAESRGIVDLLAIRKDHTPPREPLKRGDLFQLVLIQVKGGSAANPSTTDIVRLKKVRDTYNAQDVVLATWKIGKELSLKRLVGERFEPVTSAAIFGPAKKKRPTKIKVVANTAPLPALA